MRMKQLVPGLNNSQKVRFLVNNGEFGFYCTVQEAYCNQAVTKIGEAVRQVLVMLGKNRKAEKEAGGIAPCGMLATANNGVVVQIDMY